MEIIKKIIENKLENFEKDMEYLLSNTIYARYEDIIYEKNPDLRKKMMELFQKEVYTYYTNNEKNLLKILNNVNKMIDNENQLFVLKIKKDRYYSIDLVVAENEEILNKNIDNNFFINKENIEILKCFTTKIDGDDFCKILSYTGVFENNISFNTDLSSLNGVKKLKFNRKLVLSKTFLNDLKILEKQIADENLVNVDNINILKKYFNHKNHLSAYCQVVDLTANKSILQPKDEMNFFQKINISKKISEKLPFEKTDDYSEVSWGLEEIKVIHNKIIEDIEKEKDPSFSFVMNKYMELIENREMIQNGFTSLSGNLERLMENYNNEFMELEEKIEKYLLKNSERFLDKNFVGRNATEISDKVSLNYTLSQIGLKSNYLKKSVVIDKKLTFNFDLSTVNFNLEYYPELLTLMNENSNLINAVVITDEDEYGIMYYNQVIFILSMYGDINIDEKFESQIKDFLFQIIIDLHLSNQKKSYESISDIFTKEYFKALENKIREITLISNLEEKAHFKNKTKI